MYGVTHLIVIVTSTTQRFLTSWIDILNKMRQYETGEGSVIGHKHKVRWHLVHLGRSRRARSRLMRAESRSLLRINNSDTSMPSVARYAPSISMRICLWQSSEVRRSHEGATANYCIIRGCSSSRHTVILLSTCTSTLYSLAKD